MIPFIIILCAVIVFSYIKLENTKQEQEAAESEEERRGFDGIIRMQKIKLYFFSFFLVVATVMFFWMFSQY